MTLRELKAKISYNEDTHRQFKRDPFIFDKRIGPDKGGHWDVVQ